MRILTFRGRSMQETLERVRHEAGHDAVILSSGTSMAGDCEVSVAVEPDGSVSPPPAPTQPPAPRRPPPGAHESTAGLDTVLRRLDTLESYIRFRVPFDSPVFSRLLAAGIPEETVRTIAEECTAVTEPETERYVAGRLRALVNNTAPLPTRGVIAFVGTTGVGKTTTVAKLAARYSLELGRRVGLVSLDGHRIAGATELRAFASILDLPVESVSNLEQGAEAAERMRDRDIVLVDTEGLDGRGTAAASKPMLSALGTTHVQLVLPATHSAADLRAAVDRFHALALKGLIVTRVDEAARPGILVTASALGPPLSHITDGQAIPDDIRDADAELLVELVQGTHERE